MTPCVTDMTRHVTDSTPESDGYDTFEIASKAASQAVLDKQKDESRYNRYNKDIKEI